MNSQSFERKLAAILYADVAGYSRLTGDDEEGTHGCLSDYLNRIAAAVERHHGQVAHYAGDAVLAQFGTVTDALVCATDIQRELWDCNSKLPDERRLQFRIGVNLGEVIVDRGDIYGDGVNVAARLESLAEPGGICISGTVHDAVGSRLSLAYEFLGEKYVKNIRNAVRVFRVRSDLDPEPLPKRSSSLTRRWAWSAVAGVLVLALGGTVIWLFPIASKQETPSEIGTTSRVLEKPSIAVLPLENLSGDPEQEFIADGVAESIITSLSKIPEMFVIARNSSFTYKSKPVKVQQVGAELGVRYVLEGSVLRADDRLRLTVQLVESDTGHHVWAERYDRNMRDFFALLDEITQEIALALQVKLTHGEQARIWAKGARNFEAWSHVSRGLSLGWLISMENNVRAREHFKQATDIDPDYAFAWAMLGETYYTDLLMRWSDTWEARERLFEFAEKALALDDALPEAHALMAHAHRVRGNSSKAIATGKRAVALGPSHASVHSHLAYIMVQSGRPEDALGLMGTAMRLQPYYPAYYLAYLGLAQHQVSRYEEARLTWQQLIERARGGEFPVIPAHILAIATELELGQIDTARRHLNEALRYEPRLRLESIEAEVKRLFAYKHIAEVQKLFAPLRDPQIEGQEPRMHVHRGSPAFKFRYPADGRPEPMFGFSMIADIDLPHGQIEVNVWEIPGGVALEDVGTAVYAPRLELAGSNLRTVASETTETTDGTKAHKQEYKWLWRDGDTWLTTISLAVFKEDKWVHMAVHTGRDPREVDWIVESLRFDVRPEDLTSTETKSSGKASPASSQTTSTPLRSP
jgi:adenylate cyclase